MGRFELGDELGAGGMGTVFRAIDVELQREVAVKVLRPEVTGPEARVRITREAQAMAKLAHPNVVRVHELGDDDAGVYLVMELVEGQSLTSWLAEKARSVDDVVDVFLAAATGLTAAHDAGLVHRDFKPENVLVDRRGKVRVTDFGLVCVSGEKAVVKRDEPLDLLSLALTQTGAVVGTPRYMAPEQFLGKRVDARTDQFAFCVALYRALYGEAPFAGTKYGELMDSVIEGRVREVGEGDGKGVRDDVRAVVVRGLAADPEKRFAGMGALAEALKLARRKKRSWRSGAVAAAVAVAVAAVAAVAVAVAVTSGSSAHTSVSSCTDCGRLLEGGALVASDVLDVSAGPHERVAWTEKRGSTQVIVVREKNGRHEIMSAELAPAQLAFSPENEQVAFRGKHGIFVMQSPSATPERLTDGDDRDPVWLDMDRIAFTRGDGGAARAMVATITASAPPVVLAEGRRVLDAAAGGVLLADGDRLSVLRDGKEVPVDGVPAGTRRARFAGASLVVATAHEVWRLGATRERVYEGNVLDVAVTSDGRVMVVVK